MTIGGRLVSSNKIFLRSFFDSLLYAGVAISLLRKTNLFSAAIREHSDVNSNNLFPKFHQSILRIE